MRMQFEIPDDRYRELETLIKEAGFKSKADFFDNAIALFKWTVKHAKKGNIIAAVDEREHKYIELQMPYLDRVTPQFAYEATVRGSSSSSSGSESAA